ncbi:MAG: hypothetical protein DRI90_16830 [Deltaproteobacteria bacterium]|nr:MAG: hypothetical protein DRI90_16830 [Deltaproteobacteria bacterium]
MSILRPLTWIALTIVTVALALPACEGDDEGAGSLCDPGSNIFCRCPGGEPGTKACLEDGESFDECVVGPSEPCPDRPSSSTSGVGGSQLVCEPGTSVYCTCDDSADGSKTCDHEGSGFGPCICSGGVGGGGGGTAGGECCNVHETPGCGTTEIETCVCAQDSYCCDTEWDATCVAEVTQFGCGTCDATGTKPLFAPCIAGTECQSGMCPMGYCTITGCTGYADCGGMSVGECVQLDGQPTCAPSCTVQNDCTTYGCGGTVCSECGFSPEVEIGWPVTVCADWGSSLALPPDGTSCSDDVKCTLGHEGKERICHLVQTVCASGCHVHADCPGALICDDANEPGACW